MKTAARIASRKIVRFVVIGISNARPVQGCPPPVARNRPYVEPKLRGRMVGLANRTASRFLRRAPQTAHAAARSIVGQSHLHPDHDRGIDNRLRKKGELRCADSSALGTKDKAIYKRRSKYRHAVNGRFHG